MSEPRIPFSPDGVRADVADLLPSAPAPRPLPVYCSGFVACSV